MAMADGRVSAVEHPNKLPDTMDSIFGWRRCAVRALDELLDELLNELVDELLGELPDELLGELLDELLDELIDGDDYVLDSDDGVAVDEKPSAPGSNKPDDLPG